MNHNDFINGLFECGGGLASWFNVYAIIRDKQIRGVSLAACAYFWSWGLWNLYYYPSLNQMWSFYGGMVVCAANFVWMYFAIRYRFRGHGGG
jgi:hypothetical protein